MEGQAYSEEAAYLNAASSRVIVRDKLAMIATCSLIFFFLFLLVGIFILVGFGRTIPPLLEYLTSGMAGAFGAYVTAAGTYYFPGSH